MLVEVLVPVQFVRTYREIRDSRFFYILVYSDKTGWMIDGR